MLHIKEEALEQENNTAAHSNESMKVEFRFRKPRLRSTFMSPSEYFRAHGDTA